MCNYLVTSLILCSNHMKHKQYECTNMQNIFQLVKWSFSQHVDQTIPWDICLVSLIRVVAPKCVLYTYYNSLQRMYFPFFVWMGSINVLHAMHRHNKSTKMSQTTPLLEPIAWAWYTLPNLNLHLRHVFYIKLVREMRPNIKLHINN
jgi:hypothetical protein